MEEPPNLSEHQLEVRHRLSANLKRLRALRGLSQEALAARAGVHRTYASQVERKVVNTSLDNIALLAQALEVDVAELFSSGDVASVTARPALKKADSLTERKTRRKPG
ncbi:helix-turn-helix domain-containing protein [Caballeronia fortuita]|uniref:helix-turn-helix domain-containing protein n=1 Tax=Caballeronia fortuita TaxID=1777138 RepID=UPI0009415BC4|nr:helix-turn-helix transcriptional regulator [Caballeronia fortuita]